MDPVSVSIHVVSMCASSRTMIGVTRSCMLTNDGAGFSEGIFPSWQNIDPEIFY